MQIVMRGRDFGPVRLQLLQSLRWLLPLLVILALTVREEVNSSLEPLLRFKGLVRLVQDGEDRDNKDWRTKFLWKKSEEVEVEVLAERNGDVLYLLLGIRDGGSK